MASVTCETCGGAGYTERQIGGDGFGGRCAALADVPVTCWDCRGTGEVCERCRGSGAVMVGEDGSGERLAEVDCECGGQPVGEERTP